MKIPFAIILLLQPAVVMAELRVVDSQARPVAATRVEIAVLWEAGGMDSPVPAARISGVTDEAGIAPVRVPAADHVVLVADHAGFEPARIEAREGELPREIHLKTGFVWESRVSFPGEDAGSADRVRGNICASGRLTLGAPGDEHVWQRCASLDEDGRFRLAGLPDGTMRIEAQAVGFLPIVATLDPREDPPLAFERGVRVRAVIRDVRDRVVPDAVCRAGERSRARADGTARCTVSVRQLPARLEIRAPGFRRWEREITSEDEVEVRLVPAEQVFGTLLAWDGEPITAADVWIEQVGEEGKSTSTKRSVELDDGAFMLDLPGPGTYLLRFHAAGHRELRLPPLAASEHQAVGLGVFGLTRGAGVRGRVVDEVTGAPLEGALVEILPVGPLLLRVLHLRPPSGVTDENGEFLVAGLAPGRFLVRLQRTGTATWHRLVDLPSDEIVTLETVSAGAGIELSLRLLDGDRHPRAGLQVRLWDAARELLEPLAIATSDIEGRARFPNIAPGVYRAEVRSERLLLAQKIEVGGDNSERVLRVSGVRLHGRVTRDGVPVSGGFVRITSALDPSDRRGKIQWRARGSEIFYGLPESSLRAEVGPEGTFLIEDAPPGLATALYVGASGEVVVRSLTTPDQENAAVTIDLAGVALEGRVVEEGTEVGVAAAVDVTYTDGKPIASLRTDPHGWFRVDDLEPGAYDAKALADGYTTARLRGIVVAAETPHQKLQLRPGEPGAIEVALARADGTPIEGAPVTVFDREGNLVRSLPTTVTGGRAFAGLPDGEYFVAWMEPLGGAGATALLRSDAGRTTKVDRVLDVGASVVLVCPATSCGGAPVELLDVRTMEGLDVTPLLSGITPALRFGEDGELPLGRLARGKYLFRLWVAGGRWEKELTIAEGEARVRVR